MSDTEPVSVANEPGTAAAVEPEAPLPPLAGKANDLEALRAAVVDAANVGAGLWISYLFVLLYLLIAAGSVTHVDLLFEAPVKLPFLSVDLPLTAFFVLGPLMFLIVHAYVLLHFAMLAGKVTAFDQELRAQIGSLDIRTRLRRQLPSNIFVQYLAGPMDVRDGVMGLMLWLIAVISLVIAPIAALLMFELQFLPYHDGLITWWQRLAVMIDLVLMWLFWPRIALQTQSGAGVDYQPSPMARAQTVLTRVCMVGLSAISAVVLLVLATVPGEALESWVWNAEWFLGRGVVQAVRQPLLDGPVNQTTRKPTSLWSNRLVLPGFDLPGRMKLDTEAKLAAVTETASFRGRHLEGAVFIGADLRKVDFTGAEMAGVRLDSADLRGARFECGELASTNNDGVAKGNFCTQLQGAVLRSARLSGATLNGADLRNASLQDAQAEGVSFAAAAPEGVFAITAKLAGATLTQANLAKAHLAGADLRGADLSSSDLSSASLQGAQLHGAVLTAASLFGADLAAARLPGAILYGANLQGAHLYGTNMNAALLHRADLRGATILSDVTMDAAQFDEAQVQGTPIARARLDHALVSHVFAWRSDPLAGGLRGARVVDVRSGNAYYCVRAHQPDRTCPWTTDVYRELAENMRALALEDSRRREDIDAFLKVIDPDQALPAEQPRATEWAALAAKSMPDATYLAELAARWQAIGCARDGAPFVTRRLALRLTQNDWLPFPDAEVCRIAAAFLSDKCEGARGLGAGLIAGMKNLRDGRPVEEEAAKP